MGDGTWVGLDVHARSVVAALIDEATGECRVTGAPADTAALAGWVQQMKLPCASPRRRGRPGSGWHGPLSRRGPLPGGGPEPDPAGPGGPHP